MLRICFLSFALFCLSLSTKAQEFKCEVTINTPKLQTADPKIFKSLKTSITEFVNNRKWSNRELELEEKIDFNIVITIDEEASGNTFKGQIMIQGARPVYGSSYNSVLIQHLDKDFTFTYQENEYLEFTENTYTSNLPCVIAFYAYVILGLDADSFSELGGEVHLQKAQDIANSAPSGALNGWKLTDRVAVDGRSRHYLISNLLNPRAQAMRRGFYQYHLLGLDRLYKPDTRAEGLISMLQALETVGKLNLELPSSMIVHTFAASKKDEVIQAFAIADMNTRRKVYDIMSKIDPLKIEDYKQLLK